MVAVFFLFYFFVVVSIFLNVEGLSSDCFVFKYRTLIENDVRLSSMQSDCDNRDRNVIITIIYQIINIILLIHLLLQG